MVDVVSRHLQEIYNNCAFCVYTMCINCVKEEYPDRNNLCHDTGAYLMNFKGCSECKETDQMKEVNRSETEEDEQELVKYQHVCQKCNHVVAEHEHRFKVEEDFQVYEMYCLLCGTADDERSILPADPRQQAMFF